MCYEIDALGVRGPLEYYVTSGGVSCLPLRSVIGDVGVT